MGGGEPEVQGDHGWRRLLVLAAGLDPHTSTPGNAIPVTRVSDMVELCVFDLDHYILQTAASIELIHYLCSACIKQSHSHVWFKASQMKVASCDIHLLSSLCSFYIQTSSVKHP